MSRRWDERALALWKKEPHVQVVTPRPPYPKPSPSGSQLFLSIMET